METKNLTTKVCISGGGPAGIVLGYLLARAGIDVVVLEKWADFFRDFRGDTMHPSTMEVLKELGLLEEFLKLPHSETREIYGYVGGEQIKVADFTHLNVTCKFVAFIPQWDFLNFITRKAKQYPSFKILMSTEGADIIEQDGKVVGVKAKSGEEEFNIFADLVVGADGRHSTLREKAGFVAREMGAPIDVLWLKLSRMPSDPVQSLGHVDKGRILIMLDRDSYWQCGFVIRKGQFEEIKNLGLESFRNDISGLVPFMADRAAEINSWDLVKLLSVTVDHLDTWYKPGLLFLGDAAHAMSPIGGIGINLAIQDAVAAANILIPAFRRGGVEVEDLAAIQRRRQSPTIRTQKLQVFMQDHIIAPILNKHEHIKAPMFFTLLRHMPFFARFPARFLALGFLPEHVDPKILK